MKFFPTTAGVNRLCCIRRHRLTPIWNSLILLGASAFLIAQQPPAPGPAPASPTSARLELPVVLRQKVIAGVTPVGTVIEARLQIATLVNGEVIPEGAILSGRVEQSTRKNGDTPSRLKLKFDSAHWKKGSASLQVYFTGCYYPLVPVNEIDHSTPVGGRGSITLPGDAADSQYPSPPGVLGPGQLPRGPGPEVPEPDVTRISSHWVRPEGINPVAQVDGSIVVISSAHNLKLDKFTTYLLTDGPLAGKF